MFQYQSFKRCHRGIVLLFMFCITSVVQFSSIAHTVYAAPIYSVSPLVIDVKVQPRDIIKKDITIKNTGTQPVTLYPTVNNISLKDGGDIQEFLQPVESDRTTSLSSWIEISRRGVDLQAGESVTIPLILRIAPDPVPDTYHAFIGFGNGGNRDEAEAQVKRGQAPGTIITLTIADDKVSFLKLSKFIISRFVTQPDNQAVTFTFINPGEEVLIPRGEIILYDGTGKEVGSVPVNDEHVSIQPGAEHTFTATVPIKGLFGKYKAFLSVEYGTTQRASLQDTSFFYIFPLKVISIVFGILLLVVICIAWYVHKRYLDDDITLDDSEHLTVHIRETASEARDHDLHISKHDT